MSERERSNSAKLRLVEGAGAGGLDSERREGGGGGEGGVDGGPEPKRQKFD